MAAAAIEGCGVAMVGIHHVAKAVLDGRLVRVLKHLHGAGFQIVIYCAERRLAGLPARHGHLMRVEENAAKPMWAAGWRPLCR
jgi:DNA-binding transcriptional LysR family regulator